MREALTEAVTAPAARPVTAQPARSAGRGRAHDREQVLALQRTAGNRAVGRRLARTRRELPAPPTLTTPAGGSGGGATAGPTCGPDVTKQVKDVVAATRAAYGGWSDDDKQLACDALESPACGGVAWDIVELHNRGWLTGAPSCATGACHDTVRVDGGCSYGGSVNYVIFGVMCDLCGIWQSTMEDMIWAYKGDTRHWYVPQRLQHAASANYGPSLEWARAGYHGWPTRAASPAEDRPGCTGSCTATLNPGFTFNLHWVPTSSTETTSDACDQWVQYARLTNALGGPD